MTLSINIWDGSLTKIIEKNILESNLGATLKQMEIIFFLKFPELTSRKKKRIVKIINETSEKFKISIRNIRRKFIDLVKNLEKDKIFQLMKVKNFKMMFKNVLIIQLSEIDELTKEKENEILKV